MSEWVVKQIGKKPKLNSPIFVEGLPGIGNVGKVVADFMIEKMKAKKLYEFHSAAFPHSVFVNEDNLVELPKIEIYYKTLKGKHDLLFLAGDIQPIDEESCYKFADKVLDLCEEYKVKEIITLGGIGLQNIPKKPIVYCTGNGKKIVEKYKKGTGINEKLYGVVGPIVGVTGILLGLSKPREIPAIALLAETFGHPMYLGVKGAREVLKVLNKKLGLNINLKDLDKEIATLEEEMLKRTEEFSNITKRTAIKKLKSKIKGETSYIG
ncbi:PAC2 family protein [Candidatus Woesearchaeota archaeon]|nr:PAC2 family protein [Candidatus Woesearchaeota archaeon]